MFIALDMRAFYSIDVRGFINLMRVAVPNYKIPSQYMIRKLTNNVYNTILKNVQEEISGLHYSLTTDAWTAISKVSFVTYTIHVINDNWKRLSFVLKTSPMKVSKLLIVLHYNNLNQITTVI